MARGIPCFRQPSLDRLCWEGSGAPGGLSTTLRRERPARRGLQWKLQDFLPPGVFNLACSGWCPQP